MAELLIQKTSNAEDLPINVHTVFILPHFKRNFTHITLMSFLSFNLKKDILAQTQS